MKRSQHLVVLVFEDMGVPHMATGEAFKAPLGTSPQ
jgi:hypothetical protein